MQTISRKRDRHPSNPNVLKSVKAVSHGSRGKRKMKASEVRCLPAAERAKYMREHAAQAAREYSERPELLIGGGEELLDY